MKQTIGVIGHGYVGQAIANYFTPKYSVVIYDPALGHTDQLAINKADLAIVCVPTNANSDGSVDLSAIESTFAWLQTPLITIKSTVPPGTTKRLAEQYQLRDRLVFSPEYAGEGGYPHPSWQDLPHPTDMKQHSFQIFGGESQARAKVIPFFQKVSGPYTRYLQTDSTTAELVKYTNNSWIATKVTFCNELYSVAKAFAVNYDELRELWLMDGRVSRSHTVVYPDRRGFDGKCIPKDTKGLYHASQAAGYNPQFLGCVLSSNDRIRQQKS